MASFTKLGKYLIRRELGKGAMGVVYEGFDPVIERVVAIKTILPAQLNTSEATSILARFKREAQAAGRLNHPHIVGIYDYGEVVAEDDHTMVASPANSNPAARVAYIAMEFVKGRELRDFFEGNERFALPEVQRIMGEVLGALAHAHANGVVHRDMKPANLIVLDTGAIKVADFGIARIEKSELTQAGTVMGTPSYMSPEQFMGQTVDGRSDIFSCGVILYQFLTGEKPFTGNTTTIMYKVLREEPLAPSMLNVSLPAAFDAVVKRAMAKNPDERYQTAQEFSDAIKTAVAGQKDLPVSDAHVPTAPMGLAANADATIASTHVSQLRAAEASRPKHSTAGAAAAAIAQAQQTPQPLVFDPTIATTRTGVTAGTAAGVPSTPRPTTPVTESATAKPTAGSKGPALAIAGAVGALVIAGGAYYGLMVKDPNGIVNGPNGSGQAMVANSQKATPGASPAVGYTPATATAVTAAANSVATTGASAGRAEPGLEPGTMVISALGLVDPKDPKFKGDAAAAQDESRADAKRQLIEKALALYIDKTSLDKNYKMLEQKLFSQSGAFIKTVIQEGATTTAKDGLLETETRAVVKVRDVQKSLNQLSKDERIEFIRNNGDPKVAIQMSILAADNTLALPPARSALAENVVKERIKSFGFRVWANDGEAPAAATAKSADFQIQGEVKVKPLSMKLEASGVTITKTALTSWTLKAIDKSSGEEIYLNTVTPTGKSWNTEDLALVEIGKLVGDEFSKNFFLQHFNFGSQKVNFKVTGLPDAQSANLLLRELRGVRQVIDAQLLSDNGQFQLQLAEGSASDLLQTHVLKPLNAKMGQNCFALAGATGDTVAASFSATCAQAAVRAKLETGAPAGLIDAPESRGKSLLKASALKSTT